VRKAAGIEMQRDETHHLFAGMLIENAHDWPADLEATCSEGDVHALVFPQGNGRIRLYLGIPKEQTQRLTGAGGQQAFLDAFKLPSLPGHEALSNATPAGPAAAFPNEDSWTDTPYAAGCVLIGDAAGWNDPIVGQGLSITYRDVRLVRDILLTSDDWSPAVFAPYAEERRERMRRLRFSAMWLATLDSEFGDEAEARRGRAAERQAANPLYLLPLLAVLTGPESVPPQAFDESLRAAFFA
jgi:2-polyprenyl-6-methoxyphenol hydroxylase-like FAD-dependent oxidoreductase